MQTFHVYYIPNDIYVFIILPNYAKNSRFNYENLFFRLFLQNKIFDARDNNNPASVTLFIFEDRTLSRGNATLSIRITLYRSLCELEFIYQSNLFIWILIPIAHSNVES